MNEWISWVKKGREMLRYVDRGDDSEDFESGIYCAEE